MSKFVHVNSSLEHSAEQTHSVMTYILYMMRKKKEILESKNKIESKIDR